MTDDQLIEHLKGVREIVINCKYGGFGLSHRGLKLYQTLAGIPPDPQFYQGDIARDDPYLVRVVRELGDQANGSYAKLKIVTIPSEVDWQVEEYDGTEWVAEVHRTWD